MGHVRTAIEKAIANWERKTTVYVQVEWCIMFCFHDNLKNRSEINLGGAQPWYLLFMLSLSSEPHALIGKTGELGNTLVANVCETWEKWPQRAVLSLQARYYKFIAS